MCGCLSIVGKSGGLFSVSLIAMETHKGLNQIIMVRNYVWVCDVYCFWSDIKGFFQNMSILWLWLYTTAFLVYPMLWDNSACVYTKSPIIMYWKTSCSIMWQFHSIKESKFCSSFGFYRSARIEGGVEIVEEILETWEAELLKSMFCWLCVCMCAHPCVMWLCVHVVPSWAIFFKCVNYPCQHVISPFSLLLIFFFFFFHVID